MITIRRDRRVIVSIAILTSLSHALLAFTLFKSVLISCLVFCAIFMSLFKSFMVCHALIINLKERMRSYRQFVEATALMLTSLPSYDNATSLFVDVISKLDKSHNKLSEIIKCSLHNKLFIEHHNPPRKAFSPFLTKLLLMLLHNAYNLSKDEFKEMLMLLHGICKRLHTISLKVKNCIRSESLKSRVLLFATSMTLAFIVKTSYLLVNNNFLNLSSDPLVLMIFSLTLILTLGSLTPYLQLRSPSIKEIALFMTIFFAVILIPLP